MSECLPPTSGRQAADARRFGRGNPTRTARLNLFAEPASPCFTRPLLPAATFTSSFDSQHAMSGSAAELDPEKGELKTARGSVHSTPEGGVVLHGIDKYSPDGVVHR